MNVRAQLLTTFYTERLLRARTAEDAKTVLGISDSGGTDPNLPTSDEKDALAGTSGSPSAANPFATDQDPRMTDARTPLAHGHPQSDITNLVADLAGKAAAVHTHAQADVTNLVADLAGKLAATAFSGLAKITVSNSAPVGPAIGDLWVDTT